MRSPLARFPGALEVAVPQPNIYCTLLNSGQNVLIFIFGSNLQCLFSKIPNLSLISLKQTVQVRILVFIKNSGFCLG